MKPRMFETTNQTHDRHIVIPDMHGEFEVVDEVISRYIEQDDIGFVFLGDVIDRQGPVKDHDKGVFRTIESVRELGSRAILCIANHEHIMLAGMLSANETIAQGFSEGWLGVGRSTHMEVNTLFSYGIDAEKEELSATHVRSLKEEMEKAGHLTVLTSATPYFETEKFIATHAGINRTSDWEAQKEWLEEVAEQMRVGVFYEQPKQWWGIDYAKDARPIVCTDKVVVSGHAHTMTSYKFDPPEIRYSLDRVLDNGKRVRLGSQLNEPAKQNAFVWQDWDGKVIELSRE